MRSGCGRAQRIGLDLLPFIHVHRAVQTHHREAAASEEVSEHRLGWDELCEDQDLQVGIPLLSLQAVQPLEERLGLGVRACRFVRRAALRSISTSARSLSTGVRRQTKRIHLLLTVELLPILFGDRGEQHELLGSRLEHL